MVLEWSGLCKEVAVQASKMYVSFWAVAVITGEDKEPQSLFA